MRPFCVPFGLPHHAHAAEILGDDCSPEVYAETNAEELAMRRQVNAECAAIDDCAANMLSDSVFFGGDGFAPGDGEAVHRFIFARDLFRAIRDGEKDAIVEEHARAALARNDAGSLTHAIQEVLRRCEAALAKPRVIRREAYHIGPCMRSIERSTLVIHTYAAEIRGDDCSPEVYAATIAEELAMRRQVNAECAAIDDCAANMLSDSVFFGGDGFAPGDGEAVHRFLLARFLFRDICKGEKHAIVEEHARAALARNDAGSLTHAIQEVLRRCEAALAKPRVIRREACHIGPCMRAIQRYTRVIHTCAAEIRGDAATIDEELAMRRPVNAEYAAIAAVFERCGTAR